MSEEKIRNLIASNAKAIAALTQLANEILSRIDEKQKQIESMQRQHLDTLKPLSCLDQSDLRGVYKEVENGHATNVRAAK